MRNGSFFRNALIAECSQTAPIETFHISKRNVVRWRGYGARGFAPPATRQLSLRWLALLLLMLFCIERLLSLRDP